MENVFFLLQTNLNINWQRIILVNNISVHIDWHIKFSIFFLNLTKKSSKFMEKQLQLFFSLAVSFVTEFMNTLNVNLKTT